MAVEDRIEQRAPVKSFFEGLAKPAFNGVNMEHGAPVKSAALSPKIPG